MAFVDFTVVVLFNPDEHKRVVVGPEAFHAPETLLLDQGPGTMPNLTEPAVFLHVATVDPVRHLPLFFVEKFLVVVRLKVCVMFSVEGSLASHIHLSEERGVLTWDSVLNLAAVTEKSRGFITGVITGAAGLLYS